MKSTRLPVAALLVVYLCITAYAQSQIADTNRDSDRYTRRDVEIAPGEDGNARFVVAPTIGSMDRLMQDGFVVEIQAKLGVDYEGKILGGHSLDLILAPPEIAANKSIGRANRRHLLYLNLKGNGQWDLFHQGEKLLNRATGPENPFRYRERNGIQVEVTPSAGGKPGAARVRISINGTPVGEAEIDWSRADKSLTLALHSFNATHHVKSLKVTPLLP